MYSGVRGDEMSVQQAGTDIRVLRELEGFPLAEALFGRRSRRFARGAMGGTTCVAREAQYVFDTFGKFPGRCRRCSS